jgi:putative intracellular protease/amidase
VGLICHAPALLTRLPADASPFGGRLVTSVSGLEEFFIETFIMGGRARDRGIAAQLERRGLRYSGAFAGRGHAVRDCNLVTSQNPYSGAAFGAHYLAALEDWRRGARCSCEAPAPCAR